MEKSVKNQIIQILVNPSTVTEIKNQLPKVKSLGTIAYHLRNLESENIITKIKDKKKQGQPTTYSVKSKESLAFFEKMDAREKKEKIAFLLHLKKNPGISDNQIINDLINQGFNEDSMADSSMAVLNENLATMSYNITKKGEKFLKDNGKKWLCALEQDELGSET